MGAFFLGLLQGAADRQHEKEQQRLQQESVARKQKGDLLKQLMEDPRIRPEGAQRLAQKYYALMSHPLDKKLPKQLDLSEEDMYVTQPGQSQPNPNQQFNAPDVTGLSPEQTPPQMIQGQPQRVSIFKSNYEQMLEKLHEYSGMQEVANKFAQERSALEHKQRMEELAQTAVTAPLYGTEKDLEQMGITGLNPGRYAIVRSKSGQVLNYYPVEEKPTGVAGKLQRVQLQDPKTGQPFMAIFNPDPNSQYHYFRQDPSGQMIPITDPSAYISPQTQYGPPIVTQSETGEIQGAWYPSSGRMISAPGEGLRKTPLPTEELDKRVTSSNLLEDASRIRTLATKHKDILGPWMGKAISGGVQNVPEPIRSMISDKLNNPEIIELIRLSDNARNQLLYALSGKQINEKEYDRLSKLVPRYDTDPSVFFTRLDAYEKDVRRVLQKKQTGDYRVNPVPPTTAIPRSSSGYGPTETKTLKDGSKVKVRKNLKTNKYEEVQ